MSYWRQKKSYSWTTIQINAWSLNECYQLILRCCSSVKFKMIKGWRKTYIIWCRTSTHYLTSALRSASSTGIPSKSMACQISNFAMRERRLYKDLMRYSKEIQSRRLISSNWWNMNYRVRSAWLSTMLCSVSGCKSGIDLALRICPSIYS